MRTKFIATAILVALGLLNAPTAFAHGELLIRIGEVSQQINAATNKSAKLYLERAELYRMDENWAAAEADYARAEDLAPNVISVRVCHAGMLADSGQCEAARAMYTAALRRSPATGDALIGRARVFVKLGQRKAAIADFRRGLELVTEPAPELYVELAEALAIEGAAEDALSILERGIKKLGPLSALEAPAIDFEMKRKNCDGALARIDSLLPQLLRKENWLARRGDILAQAGRQMEARKSYDDAIVAIKLLPWRVQQSSPMMRLKGHIEESLRQITEPALAGK